MEKTLLDNQSVRVCGTPFDEEYNTACISDSKSVHLPNYYVRNLSIANASWGPGIAIQEDSYLMTRNEFLLLTFAFANIKRQDQQFEAVVIPLVELCRLAGYSLKGSTDYHAWGKTIRRLATRTLNYVENGESAVFCPYFSTCRIDMKTKMVTLKLNPELAPYFLCLEKHKTIFLYGYLRQLNTINTCLFYLLCSSARSMGHNLVVDMEHLKMSHGYRGDTRHFLSDVLLPSIHEINLRTDLFVTLEYLRTIRSITAVRFFIRQKSSQEIKELNISPENKRISGRPKLSPEEKAKILVKSNAKTARDIHVGGYIS